MIPFLNSIITEKLYNLNRFGNNHGARSAVARIRNGLLEEISAFRSRQAQPEFQTVEDSISQKLQGLDFLLGRRTRLWTIVRILNKNNHMYCLKMNVCIP